MLTHSKLLMLQQIIYIPCPKFVFPLVKNRRLLVMHMSRVLFMKMEIHSSLVNVVEVLWNYMLPQSLTP